MTPQPEQQAHETIDRLLTSAGWHVCDTSQATIHDARGVAIREFPLPGHGYADYLLSIDGKAAGEQRETRDKVAEATLTYHPPLPLGEGASFLARLQYMPPLEEHGLWPAQIKAIQNLERSLKENRPRALIQMATDSGKTFTAISFIYRLIKFAGARRVLFLVDRPAERARHGWRALGFRAERDARAKKVIATGTDIKAVEVVMFMRAVKSRSFFEQMKGRGVRIMKTDDLQSVTPDAVGVCEQDKTDSRPMEQKPTVSHDKTTRGIHSRQQEKRHALGWRNVRSGEMRLGTQARCRRGVYSQVPGA